MLYSRKFNGSGSIRYLLACAAFGVAACSEPATGPAPHVSRQLRPQLQAANVTTITFVSDPTWSGQNVCLNAFSPLVCPAGATVYGYPGSGWGTDLSTISGARWLWMSGVTGSSASYPAVASFSKSFSPPGTPISGSISIGADDFAELIVNGATVGAIGSTTNSPAASLASSTLQTFDITTYLIAGTNIITVRGANGNFGCGAAANIASCVVGRSGSLPSSQVALRRWLV